jgi:hypothetical protein
MFRAKLRPSRRTSSFHRQRPPVLRRPQPRNWPISTLELRAWKLRLQHGRQNEADALCSRSSLPLPQSSPRLSRFHTLQLRSPSTPLTSIAQRYTVQPTGIYAWINRMLALDPNRSTGIPMNPQFRNPPPGSIDPMAYDDPVTVPAADLAENPYWKRDVRRRYPQLSTVTQSDAVALLSVGSAAQPKQDLIGEAGTKQLVAAQEEGQKGLAVAFQANTGLAKDVLGPGGMPPLPSGMYLAAEDGTKQYNLDQEQSYPDRYVYGQIRDWKTNLCDSYPCRSFI